MAIDGIWIDMNEPSNFGTGFYNGTNSYAKEKYPQNQTLKCPQTGADAEYDFPPYYTVSGYNIGAVGFRLTGGLHF